MSVAWSRQCRRALSVTIAHPRRFEFAGASSTRESKHTAWVRRRSAELLGESVETPFRSADVAEPIRVFILDNLAHEPRAALAEPLERLVDVAHGKHDAQVAQRVYRSVPVVRDGRRREKPR